VAGRQRQLMIKDIGPITEVKRVLQRPFPVKPEDGLLR
jgi:hypothetical protein